MFTVFVATRRATAAATTLRAAARGLATFTGHISPEDPTRYVVPDGTREAYERDGYVVLKGFLSEAEVAPIEVICERRPRGRARRSTRIREPAATRVRSAEPPGPRGSPPAAAL